MIETILVFGLGIFIGARVSSWLHQMATREMLKDLGVSNEDLIKLLKKQHEKLGIPFEEEQEQEQQLEIIEVRLEQHQGQLYAFRKDNDTFLGQGVDRDSLIDHISKRMKNVKLVISHDDGGELLQKNNI